MTTPTVEDPLRAGINRVVTTGPSFLRGDIDADAMANTMVDTAQTWAAQREMHASSSTTPADPQLEMVMREIYGCGSGYLAGRCDGACVARTITMLVDEFGETS